MTEISISARSSPLSQAQTQEVLKALQKHHPFITFKCHFIQSHGDLNLGISLRSMDKLDFFTREIDELVQNKTCQVSIHSAKDLPKTLPIGLKIIAITRGIDPSDSLVFREYENIKSLKPHSMIATSSIKREEIVKKLRPDLKFCDLRGTIEARLDLLQKGEADGVVVAEAALLRLNLSHLNRMRLPGETTPLQGQIAIMAREDDLEMEKLFECLDSRKMSRSLYLGPEYPLRAFEDRLIIHCPLIQTTLRTPCPFLSNWPQYSHLILTSKTAVRSLISLLRQSRISPHTLANKQILVVGKATADLVQAFGAQPLIAEEETAEGVVAILEKIPLQNTHFFWPHSSLSRPLIERVLKEKNACFTSCILYDTESVPSPTLPSLSNIQEILFSSPSTVNAFFDAVPSPPPHLRLTPIGKVTLEKLKLVKRRHYDFKEI